MKKIIFLITALCLISLLSGPVCLARDSFRTPDSQDSRDASLSVSPAKEYEIRRLTDYDTGYTLSRCCVPSDYFVQSYFYHSLAEGSDCSIDCPFQIVTQAVSPDGNTNMIYRSEMVYLYPPDPGHNFQEGKRYGTNMNTLIAYPTPIMMYPQTALEFADKLVSTMIPADAQIRRTDTRYTSDADDPFLAQQSQSQMAYSNLSSPLDFLFRVKCQDISTSCADVTYEANVQGQSAVLRMILSTQLQHMVTTDLYTNVASDFYVMTVPYIYCVITPADQAKEAMADFDLFAANTRATDEFVIINRQQSQMLHQIVSQGWSEYNEESLWRSLGTDDGTFYEDRFSDYMFDQNEYITSDGKPFKVPTSYDYVYETADGEIFVSNSAEQPAGSTRLYAR